MTGFGMQHRMADSLRLPPFLSQKLRFWSLVAMLCLVYVHGYNLHPRYLQPWTTVDEPFTLGNGWQYFLANGVLRFRIPLLFAISGYLLAWRDDGRLPHRARVGRRLRTLGLPYLLWSGLWLAALWALEQFPGTGRAVLDAEISPFWPRQLLGQYTAGELLVRALVLPAPFQLWFLRSLLVYNLAYPWLKKAVAQWPRWYFSIAGLLWLAGVPLPLVEGEGLLFFGLGLWLAQRGYDVQRPPRWFRPGLGAALWLGTAALHTGLAFGGGPARGLGHPLLLLTLHRIGEISGLLTAWFGLDGLVRAAMARGWFRWLTGFSFIIYALHVPAVNYATEAALCHGATLPQPQLLTYLLVPPLIIAGSVALGAGLRRVAPKAYGLLTGGRGLATP